MDNEKFLSQYKALIEYAYNLNKEKVTLVTHSMGGKLTLYLFNHIVDQAWKNKYIDKWIGFAPAFLGST